MSLFPDPGRPGWPRADTSVGRSLAAQLLRVIFGCYFVVAVVVTAGQVVTEYRSAHQRLEADIQAMQRTFGRGLADAMWSFNDGVLRGILTGIAEMPVVAGVEVRDEHGRVVERAGAAEGRPRAFPSFEAPFGRSFDLVYVDENDRPHPVGSWTVRSDDGIAFDQVRDTLVVILVNSALKTLTLWVIFFVVIRRMVGRPLAEIGEFLGRTDATTLGTKPLVLGTRGRHELHLLAAAFNAMAAKLRRAFDENAALLRDLRDANASLQSRVAERTRDLELLARTDQLTGIHNRRKLDEALEAEMAQARAGSRFSVILCDVDHFKSINDRHGHRTGDAVLVAVAAALRDGLRDGETLGRWGGEEFMILCPESGLTPARDLADDLRRAVEGAGLPVAGSSTCSFGVAELAPFEGVDSLIMRADAALYAAKRNGRNRVEASAAPLAGVERRSAA